MKQKGARPKRPKGGPLQRRLHGLLETESHAKRITQTSLGHAVGWSQENAGQYIRQEKAGTLDLDQADAALRHIGSSLGEFMAGVLPPEPSRLDLIMRKLAGREELWPWVEALIAVPQRRLPVVLGQIDSGVYAATGRRLIPYDESGHEKTPAGHTKVERAKRR